MSLYETLSSRGGVEAEITIDLYKHINERFGTTPTLTFRGPPATLVYCATCNGESMAKPIDTGTDVTKADTGFKCPKCTQKYSVTKSTLNADIAAKEKQITAMQNVVALLQDELKQLQSIKDPLSTCLVNTCWLKWETQKVDSIQESGYKCTDSGCGKYNKVQPPYDPINGIVYLDIDISGIGG